MSKFFPSMPRIRKPHGITTSWRGFIIDILTEEVLGWISFLAILYTFIIAVMAAK